MTKVVQEGHPGLTTGALRGLPKVLSGSPPSLIETNGRLLLRVDGHDLFDEG